MKPIKSIVLLAAGVLAFSACDKKKENQQTSAVENQDTTIGTGITQKETEPERDINAGAGAALAPVEATDDHDHASDDLSTEEGSGAVSDEAATEDLGNDEVLPDETEIQEEEAQDMEFVDETSSEPNGVKGGRDGRMLPKQNKIDNTASESDDIQY